MKVLDVTGREPLSLLYQYPGKVKRRVEVVIRKFKKNRDTSNTGGLIKIIGSIQLLKDSL